MNKIDNNIFDFGVTEWVDHTRLKKRNKDWWKSEEYKLLENIFNKQNIFDKDDLNENIKKKN